MADKRPMMTLRKGLVLASIAFAAGCSDATTSTTFDDGTVSTGPATGSEDRCAPIEPALHYVRFFFPGVDTPTMVGGTIKPARYVQHNALIFGAHHEASYEDMSSKFQAVIEFRESGFTLQQDWDGSRSLIGGTWVVEDEALLMSVTCSDPPLPPRQQDAWKLPRPFISSDPTLVLARWTPAYESVNGGPSKPVFVVGFDHFEREE